MRKTKYSLIDAISQGDITLAKELMTAENINTVGRAGDTALMHACLFGGRRDSLEAIPSQSDVDRSNMYSQKEYNELVRLFIDNGADINAKSDQGFTPLHYCTFVDNAEAIGLLIDKGADINAKSDQGLTPLHSAARDGNIDAFQLLIAKGADVDAINNNGDNVLNVALEECRIDVVKILLDHGVDTNFIPEGDNAMSALMLAVVLGGKDDIFGTKTPQALLDLRKKYSKDEHDALIRLLIDQGADVNAKNDEGTTALFASVVANNIDAIELLIANNADVNAERYDRQTALCIAAIANNVDVAQLLLKYGANPNVIVNKMPLLNLCSIFGNIEVVNLLLQYKVDVDISTPDQNPLLLLLYSQQYFKIMLKNNEQEFIFSNFNSNKYEIAKLLIEYGVNTDEILQAVVLLYLANKKTAIRDINSSDSSVQDKIIFTLITSNIFDVNLKTIEFLLENGANLNIAYEEPDMHPLYQAVKKENLPLLKLLVKYVDDVNLYISHNKARSLFFAALKCRNYEIIEVLIKYGASINETILYITPLFYAIYNNDMKLAQTLVENGADVNQAVQVEPYKGTISPLLYAVRFNNIEIAKFLIENGADIDYKYTFTGEDEFLALPLSIYEIANEHDDQILADFIELKGEDTILAPNRDKKFLGGFGGFDEVESICEAIDIFCKLNTKSENQTQLDRKKFFERHPELREKIINLDEEIEDARQDRLQLLQSSTFNEDIISAIESRSMEKLQKLIDAGFDLSDLNINELFIINFPSRFIYEVIRQSKNIDAQTKDGMTPLMFSSQTNDMELVKLLLDKGADKRIKRDDGKRAKDLNTDSEIRKFIISHTVPIHSPQKLVKILSNFTIDKPIKYTTHIWDFGELKKEYGRFEGYMSAVKKQFNDMKEELKMLSPNLYEKIHAFLIEENRDENYSWCQKVNINIGWSSLEGLREHCDSGKNPFDFKLKESIFTKDDIQISTFGEVINLFKQEIEIRNDFKNLELIFIDVQEKLCEDPLFVFDISTSKLTRKFYTDTQRFTHAISKIFDEIKKRPQFPNVELNTQELDDRSVEIKITQIGSTATKNASGFLEEINSGDFADIKASLTNLCDWSIEGSFNDENFRINYLHSNNVKEVEMLDDKPSGFTHVLRFYV